MIWESLLTTLGLDTVKNGLRTVQGKVSARRYKALLSAAVAELLSEHPDIDLARARILAAEATGTPPSPELLRAKVMLKRAKRHRKVTARKVKGRKRRPAAARPRSRRSS